MSFVPASLILKLMGSSGMKRKKRMKFKASQAASNFEEAPSPYTIEGQIESGRRVLDAAFNRNDSTGRAARGMLIFGFLAAVLVSLFLVAFALL